MRLPRLLRILVFFAVLGLLIYGFAWMQQHYPTWVGLVFVLFLLGGIALLGWHGSRIRKRGLHDTSAPWVPVRAVVKSVQSTGEPTASGKVPVRLWVQVDSYNSTGQRTRIPVDAEISPDAFGRFGDSTVVRLLRHPTNTLLAKLDGEIPLD